jgi:hypothetical protein
LAQELLDCAFLLSWDVRGTHADHCFSMGGMLVAGGGAGCGASAAGSGAMQSPAQIFVPLTVPTNLQPIGACGLS